MLTIRVKRDIDNLRSGDAFLAPQDSERLSAQTANRRGAAVHEAGHAVVAWALGVPVGGIEIAIGGDDAKGGAQIGPNQHLSLVDQIAI